MQNSIYSMLDSVHTWNMRSALGERPVQAVGRKQARQVGVLPCGQAPAAAACMKLN